MKNGWILSIGLALASWASAATSYTWNQTSGTGSFQESTYWTPNGTPGIDDNAWFTGAGTYGVSFASPAINASAKVGVSGGVDVTFDLAGNTWELTNNISFQNTGIARFGGGTLKVAGSTSVGASQKLLLTGGTSSFGNLMTASGGGGAIEVTGGDHTVTNTPYVYLYAPPAGGASLRLTNGTLSVKSTSARLYMVSGLVSVEGGVLSVAATPDLYGTSTLNVYTSGLFSADNAPYVARTGKQTCTLNIIGGTMTNKQGIILGFCADNTGSTGVLHLVDGLYYSGGTMNVGGYSTDDRTKNSAGIVWVSGGRLIQNGVLNLGQYLGTVGIYTQEAGSAWVSTINAGTAPTGSVCRGELYLTGGTLATPNLLNLGAATNCVGRMVQTGGDMIVSNYVCLGYVPGASGEYTCSGGSLWVANDIRLGCASNAFGKMTINAPSSFLFKDYLMVGYTASSTGELVIAGGTLSWPFATVYVGYNANSVGRLNQTGGSLSLGAKNMRLAEAAGSSGTVNLSGGSMTLDSVFFSNNATGVGRMNQTGGEMVVNKMYVGNVGTGEVLVAGGSLAVTNGLSALFIGNGSGAGGRMEISGGTNVFANVRVGQGGATGLMRFTGGQTYATNASSVFYTSGSPGTGRVEFAGGTMTTTFLMGGNHAASYCELLFDGGTVRCAESSTGDFISSVGAAKATLTALGAVLDTNGKTVAIPMALSNEVGYAGGFTKKGAGSLTLSSANNGFTGRVAVEQGALVVSGGIYLTGGVAIDSGAVLNLSSATVRDALTAVGTVSRIDGALVLKSGGALTNGVGATLSGSGVVTGKVVFATGSTWTRNKASAGGALTATGGAVFQSGVTANLTGYTEADLAAGIPLVTGTSAGAIQLAAWVPVTLDGASKNTWWAIRSDSGKTLTARVIPFGTLIRVK